MTDGRWSLPDDLVGVTTALVDQPGRVRLALLGCGHIGQDVYVRLLASRRDAQLRVIADASADAREKASALAGPRIPVVADWRDAIGRDDVDAAIVALPSALHAQAAGTAFARRLHVYVEKPLATNAADAEGVAAAQRAAGTVGMVGFNYRFNPLYRQLRAHVAEGAAGRVQVVRTVFSSPRRDVVGWRESRAAGGGVLLELGSHHADLIRWLTGTEVTSVRCVIAAGDAPDARASVTLVLDNGAIAEMLVAFGTIADDRVEVIGDRGALSVNRYRSLAPERRGIDVPGRVDAVRNISQAVARLPYLAAKMTSPWHEPSHRLALDHFIAAIRGADFGGPHLDDGLASLRIVLAAEESAATGRTVILQ